MHLAQSGASKESIATSATLRTHLITQHQHYDTKLREAETEILRKHEAATTQKLKGNERKDPAKNTPSSRRNRSCL